MTTSISAMTPGFKGVYIADRKNETKAITTAFIAGKHGGKLNTENPQHITMDIPNNNDSAFEEECREKVEAPPVRIKDSERDGYTRSGGGFTAMF